MTRGFRIPVSGCRRDVQLSPLTEGATGDPPAIHFHKVIERAIGAPPLDDTPIPMGNPYSTVAVNRDPVWHRVKTAKFTFAPDRTVFTVSPAWLAWIGTEHGLALINDVGVAAIHDHNVTLANDLRQRLGLAPSDSAIVRVTAGDAEALSAHGIQSAVRGGSVRVGFHLYNDAADVDRLVDALIEGR